MAWRALWSQLCRWRPRGDAATKARILITAELMAIVAWTLWFTRPYLDFDPGTVPFGREWGQAIMTHHLWTRLVECGPCALWMGSARAGSPALADALYGSMLHPLVIAASLIWGVPVGAKIVLAGAWLMAGLAQWLLGYLLGLGRVARLWTAAMAVVGGHLAARMELGTLGVVLSTAACALVIPMLVLVCQRPSRRSAVLLAVALTQAALGGQGYMQVGLLFMIPAVLLLFPPDPDQQRLLARRLVLAAVLTLLFIAPFLIPFLHFVPELSKDADPAFQAAQPLAYVPLNLVISDMKFYTSEVLGKLPYPSHYALFVGWIPVLLGIWGLGAARNAFERRAIIFLAVLVFIGLFVASGVPLIWLANIVSDGAFAKFITGIRYPAFTAGLVVPPLLALTGMGVDRLWRLNWPRIRVAPSAGSGSAQLIVDPRWLLVIPLVIAVNDARVFSAQFIATQPLGPGVFKVLEALRTPSAEWIAIPFGEQRYIEPAVGMGLKLADDFRTWRWHNRLDPEPVLEAHRADQIPGMTRVHDVEGAYLHAAPPGREYAALEHPAGRTLCAARARGGNIDVTCDAPVAGTLAVRENSWTGWQARVDGKPTELRSGRWLAVEVPAGSHEVAFRYRPWDVAIGIVFAVVGAAFAVYSWRERDDTEAPWRELRVRSVEPAQ
jgi:hypothetical protein